jgi:hypothetical protein
MKKRYVTVLFALIYVSGMAIGAHAQEREGTLIVKVPCDFVVQGLVLTKGTYRVSRVDTPRGARELEISSADTSASALVIPTVFDDYSTSRPQITLKQVGDKYFLTAIKTPIGTYAIPIPQSAITLANMKAPSTMTSFGTN